MNGINKEDIQELATNFRLALEKLDRKKWGSFPVWLGGENGLEGICDAAHRTLAKLIEDRFGIFPNIVVGTKWFEGNSHSHVWLEIDDLIIDVTANKNGVVFQTKIKGYDGWVESERQVESTETTDEWWQLYCSKADEEISNYLDELEAEK